MELCPSDASDLRRPRHYVCYTGDIRSDKPESDPWKRAFLETAGRPNISLPALATLKESPCPKTKRGTSSFVRVSGSAVASTALLMIGLLGRFSPRLIDGPFQPISSWLRQKRKHLAGISNLWSSRSKHNSSSAECVSGRYGRVIGP